MANADLIDEKGRTWQGIPAKLANGFELCQDVCKNGFKAGRTVADFAEWPQEQVQAWYDEWVLESRPVEAPVPPTDLNGMLASLDTLRIALQKQVNMGSERAIRTALAIETERAKLLGLYAAQKTDAVVHYTIDGVNMDDLK